MSERIYPIHQADPEVTDKDGNIIRHDNDGRYYLPDDEKVAVWRNPILDMSETRKQKRAALFEKYKNEEVHSFYERVIEYLKNLRNGFIRNNDHKSSHKIGNECFIIMGDSTLLGLKGFGGNLSDLQKFCKENNKTQILDNLIDVLEEYNF
ncbi:MAG: hypothetical protein NTU97_02620 [Candidatus Magasanikbacteria bacterium]|nr:hypothetical protein [Candidatus Magasanikbacteria bacterium]